MELAESYGEVGNLLFAGEYTEAAETYYLHAQALAPNDMRWPYYLGHVYRLRGDLAKSAASFERALRLQPNDVATLVWLGNVRLDQGQPDVAQPLFVQALSLQPRLVAALFGAGRAALARRDYSRAVDQLEQALAADPRATIIHYAARARVSRPGRHGEGRSALAAARNRRGQPAGSVDGGAAWIAAWRRQRRGSGRPRARRAETLPSAVSHFRKGVEFAPDNPSMRHKLGTALSLSGDRTRRLRSIRGDDSPLAGFRAGALQPRRPSGAGRTAP